MFLRPYALSLLTAYFVNRSLEHQSCGKLFLITGIVY